MVDLHGMRLVRGLLFFLVGVVFSVFVVPSFAATTYEAVPQWSVTGSPTVYGATYGEACQSADGRSTCQARLGSANYSCTYKAPIPGTSDTYGLANAQCRYTYVGINGNTTPPTDATFYTTSRSFVCPGAGTLTAMSGKMYCANAPDCPAGQVRNSSTGVCETPNPCAAKAGWFNPEWGCVDGCRAVLTIDINTTSTQYGSSAYGTFDGNGCTAGPGSLPGDEGLPPPPQPCPAGKFPGVLDLGSGAKAICVDGGDTGPCPFTGGTRDASGQCHYTENPSNTKTTTSTSSSTDASTGVTTTTTTTTTTNTSTGQTSQTSTTTKTGGTSGGGDTSGGGTCTGTGCGTGGADRTAGGGGDCLVAPTCSGDAIDCAVVRQTWETRCVFKSDDAAVAKGIAIAAGNDPDSANYPWDPSKLTSIDMTSKIDMSRWLSGSCPAPVSFTVWGQSMQMSFDGICPALQYAGYAAVAAALIVAARIVGTGG